MGSLLQRNRVMALSHLQYYLRDKGVRPERRSSKVCGNEQRPYAPLRDSLRVPAETLLPSDTTQHPGTTMANEPSTDLPTAREAASSSEACQEKEQAPSQAPEEEPVETREATQDPVREGPPLARMGLTKRDVLLGRGKGTTQHDGNVRYLKIIDEFAPIYQKLSTRQDQLAVKVDVVKAVHEYGGRFMQHVDGSKTEFCEAPMQVIMKKIGQVSRGAPEPREDVVGTLVALHPHPFFLFRSHYATAFAKNRFHRPRKNPRKRRKNFTRWKAIKSWKAIATIQWLLPNQTPPATLPHNCTPISYGSNSNSCRPSSHPSHHW